MQVSVIFCVSKFKKMGEFAAFIERLKAKSVRLLALPDQGLCLWTPLGAPPPNPRYRLALCALVMDPPPLSNPKYATGHEIDGQLYLCQRILDKVTT